jgi:hypothetical protein
LRHQLNYWYKYIFYAPFLPQSTRRFRHIITPLRGSGGIAHDAQHVIEREIATGLSGFKHGARAFVARALWTPARIAAQPCLEGAASLFPRIIYSVQHAPNLASSSHNRHKSGSTPHDPHTIAAGCEVIRAEKRSGTTTAGREELRTVLDFLRKGDVLMVTRIDRLARPIGDLQDIVRAIRAKGAALKATEQPIDTGTAAGKCFIDGKSVWKFGDPPRPGKAAGHVEILRGRKPRRIEDA